MPLNVQLHIQVPSSKQQEADIMLSLQLGMTAHDLATLLEETARTCRELRPEAKIVDIHSVFQSPLQSEKK